jgi:hypothetical protein
MLKVLNLELPQKSYSPILDISNTLSYIAFFYLMMDYACTYYATSQPKTTTKYLRIYAINFSGITHTSLTIN